jgi:hypothetical protein
MTTFSNSYFFPLLQFLLLALLLFVMWWDWRARRDAAGGARPGGMSATPPPTEGGETPQLHETVGFSDSATAVVLRGPRSMTALEKVTGLVIAAIITVINKSVFDDNEAGWKHYSAAINLFDLMTIIYICYLSPRSRNRIRELIERLREERS